MKMKAIQIPRNTSAQTKKPKRYTEKHPAKKANQPSEEFFYAWGELHERDDEDKKLQERIDANTGPCRTYRPSPEEMAAVLASMGILDKKQEA